MNIPTPFDRFEGEVLPEWIDHNGHMNLAYYTVLFDQATAPKGSFLLDTGIAARLRDFRRFCTHGAVPEIAGALLESEKNILKLIHSGIGEKQRRIIRRNERGAAHAAVAVLLEEFQKCFANLVAGQRSLRVGERKSLWQTRL